MRPRLNLRLGRGSRPPQGATPAEAAAAGGHAEDFTKFSFATERDGSPFAAPQPGDRPRIASEERDVFDSQLSYAQRIFTLAKRTVASILGSEGGGEAPLLEGPNGHAEVARELTEEERRRATALSAPPHNSFVSHAPSQPLPPQQPYSGGTRAGALSHGEARFANEPRPQAPAYYDDGGYPDLPTTHGQQQQPVSMLAHGADNTLTSAAPNVTVYQFFNSTPAQEPLGAGMPPWYGRHSYSFSAPRAARAGADARPTIQYKRPRAQEEEVRQLQAPPLQRRERAAAVSAQPPAAMKPAAPPASAPLSSGKTAGAEYVAPAFGAPTSASPAPAFKPTDATKPSATPAAGSNPFFKAGPPAVIPEDDGFASGSDSEDDGKQKTPAKAFSEAKPPLFSGGASAKAAPAPTTQPKGTMASPFSFGSPSTSGVAPEKKAPPPPSSAPSPAFSFGGGIGAAAATKAPATTGGPALSFGSGGASAAPAATNAFVKPGPPAVMPEDDGFAPGGDDSDGEKPKAVPPRKKDPVDADMAAPKPIFSFGLSGAASTGGASAPANPFAFNAGAKPNPPAFGTAAPASTPAAPASATAGFGGFRKPGPAAVIPEDDGFASDADDSDADGKDNAKKTRTEDAPSKTFSFGLGGGNASGPPPGNPFSFGGGGGGGSATLSFGKPAGGDSPASPFSFFQKK